MSRMNVKSGDGSTKRGAGLKENIIAVVKAAVSLSILTRANALNQANGFHRRRRQAYHMSVNKELFGGDIKVK